MDIKPVFNHYKTVACMCSYLSKSEDEYWYAMSQAVKETFQKKKKKIIMNKWNQ